MRWEVGGGGAGLAGLAWWVGQMAIAVVTGAHDIIAVSAYRRLARLPFSPATVVSAPWLLHAAGLRGRVTPQFLPLILRAVGAYRWGYLVHDRWARR